MSRQSTNFQVTQLLEATSLSVNPRQIVNDFGNFVYTDHVTRKRYDVNKLKAFNSSLHQTTQQSQLFMLTNRNNTQHDSSRGNTYENSLRGNVKGSNKENALLHGKGTKSIGSMPRIEKRKIVEIDEHQNKKWELSHFLQELKMMNRIRENRNHIVSGTQKAQKRKSMLPSLLPNSRLQNTTQSIKPANPNIDTLKQQIRLQVNSLSTQLFREYIQQQQPYRPVFNQLNNQSSKGALNRNKIKQIKQKIKQCTMERNDSNTTAQQMLKRTELDQKDDKMFEEYFAGVQKQIGEEIGFKMRHQASYNWKYGKKSTVQEILKNYQSELTLNMKDQL